MSQRHQRTMRKAPPRNKGRGLFWAIVAIGSTLAITLAGFLILSLATGGGDTGSNANVTPEVTGAPKLKADRDVIEMGDIKLGQTVEAKFALSNVGDRPLQITDKPYIEVLEGC